MEGERERGCGGSGAGCVGVWGCARGGGGGGVKEGGREGRKKEGRTLVFNSRSTMTVISGRVRETEREREREREGERERGRERERMGERGGEEKLGGWEEGR